jgi:DNA-binding CsgD family transcriptional regulator
MGLTHSASNVVFRSDLSASSRGGGLPTSSVSGSYHQADVAESPGLANQNCADFFRVGLEILDLLSVALAICDSANRLLHANQTARCMLRTSDGLRIDGSGRLRTSKPSSPVLSEVIRELTETKRAARSETTHVVIAAPRPSGMRPLIVSVLNPAFLADHSGGLVPAVPIVFWEHEEHCGAEELLLHRAWDLTPAECRFANLLMEGLSLADCCGRLGICRATGAFHLKNLFRKTGARRQIELLSILFRGVGSRSIGQRTLRAAVARYSSRVEMNMPEM